jgi:uncharacterized protein DUF4190
MTMPPRTNRLAIAALCCGIAFLFFPAAIVAVILGHPARREIRRTGEHGRGLATAGLILGYVGLALLIVLSFPVTIAMLGHRLL